MRHTIKDKKGSAYPTWSCFYGLGTNPTWVSRCQTPVGVKFSVLLRLLPQALLGWLIFDMSALGAGVAPYCEQEKVRDLNIVTAQCLV